MYNCYRSSNVVAFVIQHHYAYSAFSYEDAPIVALCRVTVLQGHQLCTARRLPRRYMNKKK